MNESTSDNNRKSNKIKESKRHNFAISYAKARNKFHRTAKRIKHFAFRWKDNCSKWLEWSVSVLKKIEIWFNRNWGWFFKNGNK
tara:strand:- start:70 stop:321 length:252 start_codon:yes stop_codon:yes gene_type:complete